MMPLIRYRTGDIAILGETPRGFVIHKLIGRTHDVVEVGGRKFATHFIQDVLNRIGGISEFQIELRGRRPLLRLVPDDAARMDDIRTRVGRYWDHGMDVEFITPSDLRLLGWRRKFRHVVNAPAAAPAQLQPSP